MNRHNGRVRHLCQAGSETFEQEHDDGVFGLSQVGTEGGEPQREVAAGRIRTVSQ